MATILNMTLLQLIKTVSQTLTKIITIIFTLVENRDSSKVELKKSKQQQPMISVLGSHCANKRA